MKFFKIIAALFSSDKDEERPGIPPMPKVKATRGVDISEPVNMMLESIHRHPKQWRVCLDLPEYKENGGFRHPMADTLTSVAVIIYDRSVGESYKAIISIKRSMFKRLCYEKMCKQLPNEFDLVDLVMTGHTAYPSWMTEAEAKELHTALSKLVYIRISQIKERRERSERKRRDVERDEMERQKLTERQRLTTLYKGNKNG